MAKIGRATTYGEGSESSLGAAGCQQHITTSARLILPSPLTPPRPTTPLCQFLKRGKCRASETSVHSPAIDQSRWLSRQPGVGMRQGLSLFPSSSSRKHTFLPYHQYIVLFSRYGAANIITNRCIVSSPQQGIKETESSSLRRFLLPSRIIFIILDNISVPTWLRAGTLSLTAKTSFLSCLFSPLHDEDTPCRPI